jgi:hypothetical protein
MLTRRLCLLALFCAPLPLSAAHVAVICADEGPAAQTVAKAAAKAVSAASVLKPGDAGVSKAEAIVAVGDAALAAELPAGVPLVAALTGEGPLPAGRKSVRVSLLPDAFVLLGDIKGIVPRLDHLGILTPPKLYHDYIKYLESAGKVVGCQLRVREVSGAADLVDALRAQSGKVDALWLAPDPLMTGSATFHLISEFCVANHIALIAPLAPLARAGALAGIAPGFESVGRTAGETAQSLAAGKPVAPMVQPGGRCEVLISGSVAKSLGIVVPAKAGQVLD